MSGEERILAALDKLKIKYDIYRHDALPDGPSLIREFESKEGCQPLLNLFCYDKKKRFYVISGPASSPINLKAVQTSLGAPSPRFASGEQMIEMLGVSPGSVTPLAAINDQENRVTFVMDESVKDSNKKLLVHPLHNEATLALCVGDLESFLASTGHQLKYVRFEAQLGAGQSQLGAGQSQPAAAPAHSKTSTPEPPNKKSDLLLGTEQLGITEKKNDNFPEWYTQVITRAEMVEYYDISGCYILRPWSYFMWETIQDFMNREIKKLGVKNSYFPMFVAKSKLEAEKDHVEGFSPEVAWVTKYGESDLAEPIALRPTSETIMYPAFARWIRSHRDLPLKLNQWCQVVRWEFKQPTPFIRTREFLWQEGHTAHATDEEAETMVKDALGIYKRTYEELLAIPVIQGFKSELEKFAGGKITTTVETVIPTNGRGVQAATSHHLGQNFSKMFSIQFEDSNRSKNYVHQTSWGFTTRSLGIAVMVHGDDTGMVMPPKVAPLQVVLIPIVYKNDDVAKLQIYCADIIERLNKINIRAELDDRDNYKPGWKYNHWEIRGVCIRMEIGPRDVNSNTVRLVRRDRHEKVDVANCELEKAIPDMLNDMHEAMLAKARANLQNSIVQVERFENVMDALNSKKVVLVPWCEAIPCEERVKAETGRLSQEAATEGTAIMTGAMKTLCIPMEQPTTPLPQLCFACDSRPKRWALWGRSY